MEQFESEAELSADLRIRRYFVRKNITQGDRYEDQIVDLDEKVQSDWLESRFLLPIHDLSVKVTHRQDSLLPE